MVVKQQELTAFFETEREGLIIKHEKNPHGLQNSRAAKLVYAALFCALTFAATYVSVPTPFAGNVNLGDGVLLLGAWYFGIPWGLCCAVGAMLADLASGYVVYMPATLVIKALMLTLAVLVRKGAAAAGFSHFLQTLFSALAAEAVMIGGYYLFESLFAGFLFAQASSVSFLIPLVNLPFNLLQALVSVAFACALAARKKPPER